MNQSPHLKSIRQLWPFCLFLLALLHDISFSDDWIGLLEAVECHSGALWQHCV